MIHDLLEIKSTKKVYVVTCVVFVYCLCGLSLPHEVLPLNQKLLMLTRLNLLISAFLIPFTGGSGPSGFFFRPGSYCSKAG